MNQWKKMVDYERKLQGESTESKIIKFDLDFAEKFKIEVGDNFRNLKSRYWQKLNEIKLKILI